MKQDRRYWMDEAMRNHDMIGHLVARIVDAEGISRDDRAWGDRFCRVLEEAEDTIANAVPRVKVHAIA
jgi:hypothetical protein